MAIQWDGNYPRIISNTTGTTVVASGSINQSGVIYFEVLASGLTAPSAAQVAAHLNASGAAVAAGSYDSKVVSASGVLVNVSGIDLSPETNYVAYFAASGYVDGILSGVHNIPFTTPDITLPAWTLGYPVIGTINKSSAVVSYKLNDAGSGYFVVVPSGESAPSASQIKAGTDANGVAIAAGLYGTKVLVANTAATSSITNLDYGKRYTIYVAGVDDANNATSPAVVSTSFRTLVPSPGVPSSFSNAIKERNKIANALRNA